MYAKQESHKRQEDGSRVKTEERQKTESRGCRTAVYKHMIRKVPAVYSELECVYCTFANRKRPLRDFSVGKILIISAVFPRSSELQSPASMGFTVSEATKHGLKVFCKNIYM